MGKIIAILCLAASIPALEQDKRDHAKAGAAIAVLSYAGLTVATDLRPWQKALASSLVATAAGWGKEWYDRQGHGTYESRDAWATALGGVGGAGVCLTLEWSF